jgi:hypothetical protein
MLHQVEHPDFFLDKTGAPHLVCAMISFCLSGGFSLAAIALIPQH